MIRRKLTAKFAALRAGFFQDRGTLKFIRHCREELSRWTPITEDPDSGEVWVEFFPVPQTMIAMAYFARSLPAVREGAKTVVLAFPGRWPRLFRASNRKFFAAYAAWGAVETYFVGTGRARRWDGRREALYRDWVARATSKDAFLRFRHDGVSVGLDIYETYLREFEQPTADLSSESFLGLVREFVGDYVDLEERFRRSRVRAIVLSHGIYRYGLVAKMAMRRGIPVYLPYSRGVNRMYPHEGDYDAVRLMDFHNYREIFAELSERQRRDGIAHAERQLTSSLSAKPNRGKFWVTESAFASPAGEARVLAESDRPKVLIATHCFFDNPHAYGGNLFPDFYEWLERLGRLAERTDYDWYVKTHRDYLPGTMEILGGILGRHPRLKLLPANVSFHQLVRDGLTHVLSVYGSVGHELPLLGVTVVNAGYNPHSAYGFNLHPQSLAEYDAVVSDLPAVKPYVDPREVYEFYFVHYFVSQIIDDFLFPSFYGLIEEVGREKLGSTEVFSYFVDRTTNEHKRAVLDKMEWFLGQKGRWFLDHRWRKDRGLAEKDYA